MSRSILYPALLLAALALLAPAARATPPDVIHSPGDDGVPHPVAFQIGVDGPHTLHLWMRTGPDATPMVSDQEVCKNGVGDEVCGLYAVVTTTGGINITGFSPAAGVSGNVVSATELRIVRLAAAEPTVGDFGAVRLGALSVERVGPGDVLLSDASNHVRADLALEGLAEEPIALPEPSRWLLLLSGIGFLGLLAHLRERSRLALVAASLAAPLGGADASAEGLFLDRSEFVSALGSQANVEGFESVPLDGNGFGAASNDASFGGGAFTWESTATAVDIDLYASAAEGGGDTGLDGTVLFSQPPGHTSVIAQPGGNASGFPAENDQFVLHFDPPVQAAGIQLFDVPGGLYGSSISFKDSSGDAVCSFGTFPSGTNDAFRGCIASAGTTIATLSFSNGGLFGPGSNVAFDDVFWAAPSLFAVDPDFAPEPKLRLWRELGPDELGGGAGGIAVGDAFGASAANVGDLNRDGVVDLAVGEPGDDTVGTDRGALRLFFLERDGTVRGSPVTLDALQGPLPLGFLEDHDRFGSAVAGLGDLDGNGVPDLLVGADGASDDSRKGRAFVLFLETGGVVFLFQEIGDGEGSFAGSLAADDEFGASVAALGDLDGDGVADAAVGAPGDDDGGSDRGAVWVLFLNADGSVKAHQKISATAGGFAGTLDASDRFGTSVAAVGDLDRDGVRDLAVGAPNDDDGGSDRGAVWILFLNDDGTVKGHAKLANDGTLGVPFGSIGWGGFVIGGAQDGDLAGSSLGWIPTPSLATPGVLAVGVPRFETTLPISGTTNEGALFFLALNRDGTVARQSGLARTVAPVGIPVPGAFDPPDGTSERFASSVAHLGDLDGDAFPDVFFGAAEAFVPGITEGGAGYVAFLSGFDATGFADAVNNGTQGCMCQPGGFGACADHRIVGAPDGSGAIFETGDRIGVEFLDNAPVLDGTPAGDVVLHRKISSLGPSGQDDVLVEVLRPGDLVWTTVLNDNIDEDQEQVPVDLDVTGWGAGTRIQSLRITVSGGQTCPDACTNLLCNDPRYDAVEAADNLNFVFDGDLDGVVDGNDNCRAQVNPTQTDSDGDGVGDVCDDCPANADPDQLDGDGDGFGDLCDEGEITLADVTPGGGSPIWELRYRCPGSASVTNLNVGIVVPPGVDPATVFFGGPDAANSCEEPAVAIPNPPVGYVPGLGCLNATELGAAVQPITSGVLGPGLVSPSGVRSDTLYLTASVTGCSDNKELSIGNLHFAGPGGGVAAVPQLTTRGVDTPGLGLSEAVRRLFRIDPYVGIVAVELQPAPGEPGGAEERWEVCVAAQGEIARLSLGFEAPAGTGTSSLRWLGCDSAPDASLRRTCAAATMPDQYEARVAPTLSCGTPPCPTYSEGPDSADSVPTLYVVLEGNDPNTEGLFRLNTANASSCLGQVELLGSPGVPPDLTLNGLEALATQPAIVAAVDSDNDGVPDQEVSTLDVSLASSSGATSEDTDQDSVADENDNCRYLANTNQANTGGLGASTGNDNIGDDCQCGDLDFDGRMLPGGPDLSILVDVLLGQNTNPAVMNRSSVVDGREANIRDAVFLQLGLDGKLPVLDQVCEDAVPPVP